MNQVIHGDSLEVLETIEKKSVQMIYMDPPYNSGRDYTMNPDDKKGFSDTWKSDNDYFLFLDNLVAKSKAALKEDGSLFLHISAQEMLIPHNICAKHFKYIQPIFWKKSRSKNNIKNKLGTAIDVIFWCYQSNTKKFNMVYQPLDEKYLNGSYKNKDTRGNYALGHLVSDPTRQGTYSYSITVNNLTFNPSRGWRVSKEDLEALLADNRVHIPKNNNSNLYKKIYLHESKGKPSLDLWDDISSLAQGSEKRLYPTAKPIKLLERIVEMSTDAGDIILDPVAGSGTTGMACKNLNRNYILIDKNKDSIEIINARLAT